MSDLAAFDVPKTVHQIKEVVKSKDILYLYQPKSQNQFQSPCPLFLVYVPSEQKTREVVLKQGVQLLSRVIWEALEQKESFKLLLEDGDVVLVADSEQLLGKYADKPNAKKIPVKKEVIDYIQATYRVPLLESWARWIVSQNNDKFVTPMASIRKQIKDLKEGKVKLPSFSDDWKLVDIDIDDYGDLED